MWLKYRQQNVIPCNLCTQLLPKLVKTLWWPIGHVLEGTCNWHIPLAQLKYFVYKKCHMKPINISSTSDIKKSQFKCLFEKNYTSNLTQLTGVRRKWWWVILDASDRKRWETSFISLTRKRIYVTSYVRGEAVPCFRVAFFMLLKIWVKVTSRQTTVNLSCQTFIKGMCTRRRCMCTQDRCYSLCLVQIKWIN